MTDTPRGRTFTNYALVPDSGGGQVLLLPADKGWSLPHWEERAAQSWGSAADVNTTLRELLGLELTVLRTLPHDPSAEHVVRGFEMENHSPHRQPLQDGRWVGRRDLEDIRLSLPGHREVLASWFDRQSADTPSGEAPWTRPGWFRAAAGWMEGQALALGRRPSGRVAQERAWSISSVLRLPTTDGHLYLKASAGLFAREPVITDYLARRFPGAVPEVLAVEPTRSWMLMEDMGGERLQRVPATAPWEEAVQVMARMQLESIERIDELLAIGCADRRLARLAAQIDPLLEFALAARGRAALTGTEGDALVSIASELKARCAALAASGIPETLEHGDFHAGNIVLKEDRIIIFDWSDAGVAHPFLVLLPFLTFRRLPNGPDAEGRLVRAYLEPWTAVAPMDRLMAAYETSRPLAALHQAVAYWRLLIEVGEEERWEWEADLPYFLRRLLPASGESG